VLEENPLLALLGRRGRGAVVEALRRNPRRAWTVRELARFADVAPTVASRAVRELAALGAVEAVRPGRDLAARFLPGTPAGAWLDCLVVPDLRQAVAATVARAYLWPAGVTRLVLWRHPDDDPNAPEAPVRVAALTNRDPGDALEAAGPALDAVRAAGLPMPEVSAWVAGDLAADDPVARAILAGLPLTSRSR
jgi:hypothetical protein